MTFNNTTPPNFFDTLATGRATSSPFVDIFLPRDPTPHDVTSATSINTYAIQQKWLNTTTQTLWELKNFISSQGVTTANWIKIGGSNIVETLTGNDGIIVPPTLNNINVVGDGTFIKTVGNAATSTLTIEPAGGLATLYTEDTGTATPMAGNLNVFGGAGIHTDGSGNTITISGTGFAFNYTNVTNAMSPYIVLSNDYYISVDCSGGVVQLNFPNSPTFKQIWIIKDRTGNASVNNITLTTPGGTVTFDGLTTYTMNSNYQSTEILANSTPTYEVF